MNYREHLVLFLLAAVLLDDTKAWIRHPRIRLLPPIRLPQVTCQQICHTVCPGVVPAVGLSPVVAGPGCHLACQRICKRSLPEFSMADEEYQVVPMSRDFSHYDLNGNKMISPKEFAKVQKVPLNEVNDVFKVVDVNGDYSLDADEFAVAPFVFENEIPSEENGNDKVETKDMPNTERKKY